MKKWIFSFILILSVFGLSRLYYFLTDDFFRSNITTDFSFPTPRTFPQLTPEEYHYLNTILGQKFTYLGKGSQSFVFESEDRKHVIKFFKFKHFKPSFFVNALPSISPFREYKEKTIERKKRYFFKVMNAYDLAYSKNRDNSGLIYVHFIPSEILGLSVTLIDKIGFKRHFQLDDVIFLIQKKGETLQNRLSYLLDNKKIEESKYAIYSIIEMYLSEYKRGIYDHDHGILYNTGFYGDHPFRIDLGKLLFNEKVKQLDFQKKDLEQILWILDSWIKNHYPQYYLEFTDLFSQIYYDKMGVYIDLEKIDPNKFKENWHPFSD